MDKGERSVECILLLFLYKLVYPDYVYLNRGNHEDSTLNLRCGFRDEISRKYGDGGGGGTAYWNIYRNIVKTTDDHFMFEFFGEVFRWMPIAHLINQKIFVVHGGISASVSLTIDHLRNKR